MSSSQQVLKELPPMMTSIRRGPQGEIEIVNQLLLPHEVQWDSVSTIEEAFDAIKSMRIRGAPAIASLAALTLSNTLAASLATLNPVPTFLTSPATFAEYLQPQLDYLNSARPTAVNLSEAMNRISAVVKQGLADGLQVGELVTKVVETCELVHSEDFARNLMMSANGSKYLLTGLPSDATINVLTVCNTGSLATSGYGTALGVITHLYQTGNLDTAYYTQTAPYHQGSRLTSLELGTLGMKRCLVGDTMVGSLFQHHKIAAVIVGADRVARNGDTANKVGTYNAAVLAKRHGAKVIVVAPWTTVDLATETGAGITIEHRPAKELCQVRGKIVSTTSSEVTLATVQITPNDVGVDALSGAYNPAFDVTPAELIDAVVTEKGVFENKGGKIVMG